jgi:hypothetical protein
MNYVKLLIAAAIGSVVNFLGGWLVYGIALDSTFKNSMTEVGKAVQKSETEFNFPLIFVSCLLTSLFIAYICYKWANISSFAGGATVGATVGFFMSLTFNTSNLAMTNMFNGSSIIFIDVVANIVISGLTGAAIGWYLGFKKD